MPTDKDLMLIGGSRHRNGEHSPTNCRAALWPSLRATISVRLCGRVEYEEQPPVDIE